MRRTIAAAIFLSIISSPYAFGAGFLDVGDDEFQFEPTCEDLSVKPYKVHTAKNLSKLDEEIKNQISRLENGMNLAMAVASGDFERVIAFTSPNQLQGRDLLALAIVRDGHVVSLEYDRIPSTSLLLFLESNFDSIFGKLQLSYSSEVELKMNTRDRLQYIERKITDEEDIYSEDLAVVFGWSEEYPARHLDARALILREQFDREDALAEVFGVRRGQIATSSEELNSETLLFDTGESTPYRSRQAQIVDSYESRDWNIARDLIIETDSSHGESFRNLEFFVGRIYQLDLLGPVNLSGGDSERRFSPKTVVGEIIASGVELKSNQAATIKTLQEDGSYRSVGFVQASGAIVDSLPDGVEVTSALYLPNHVSNYIYIDVTERYDSSRSGATGKSTSLRLDIEDGKLMSVSVRNFNGGFDD